MHRFQSVPYIGQGAAHNDRHRVIYVGRFHLLFDVDRNDAIIVLCFLRYEMLFHNF